MKYFALICLGCLSVAASAQEKMYLDKQFHQVDKPENAAWYRIVQTDSVTGHPVSSIRNMQGKIKESTAYGDKELKIRDGEHLSYRIDGTLQFAAHYKNNLRDGESRWYYPDGTLKRLETYKEDDQISGTCYGPDGKEIPFFEFEVRPQYPGGSQKLYDFINANFKRTPNDKGKMLVSFVVERDGSITEPAIVKGISTAADQQALLLLSQMGKWIPGQQDGKSVRAKFTLPITLD